MNLTTRARYAAVFIVALLIVTIGIAWSVQRAWITKTRAPSSTRLRLVFYYPWFPNHWQENGVYPLTHYHPTLGYYNSSDPIVIRRHIEAMHYAKIDGAIVSWWGRDNRYGTDTALRSILKESQGSGFQWAIYYEWEGPVDNIPRDPTKGEIVSDLDYLYGSFANDPGYLRIDGRWVLFVYSDANDGCGMASRWIQAKTAHPEMYLVLRVFPGYQACASQPDAWHQYSVSSKSGIDSQLNSSTIQLGFLECNRRPSHTRT
jgi:hypothetical protein